MARCLTVAGFCYGTWREQNGPIRVAVVLQGQSGAGRDMPGNQGFERYMWEIHATRFRGDRAAELSDFIE